MTHTWGIIEDELRQAKAAGREPQIPRAYFTILLRGGQMRWHATEADLLAGEELIAEDAPRLHFKYSEEHRQYLAHSIGSGVISGELK